jgi:hypothetical protein
MLRFRPSQAPSKVTLHSPWRRRSPFGRLFANASISHLSSSSASPVSSHPIDEYRKHTTAMRANSENVAHSPDPGRCCIMRPMLDCNRENHATIVPSPTEWRTGWRLVWAYVAKVISEGGGNCCWRTTARGCETGVQWPRFSALGRKRISPHG